MKFLTQKQFLKMCFRDSLCRVSWTDSQLPDSFRWFNAAGALLVGANSGDPNCLGGIRPGEANQYRRILDEWWDITSHDSAYETMHSLLQTGMRASYQRSMELFQIYCQQAPRSDSAHRPTNWDRMYAVWQQKGENALLGWDLCRAIIVTTWCHVCGYLSLEEMMRITLSASRTLQTHFSSWDEVMQSYLDGLFYWMKPGTPSDRRSYRRRVHLYKTLRRRNGPFASIDFFSSLSSDFSDAEKSKVEIISK